MKSSIEAQQIDEIETKRQADESQVRRIEEYVKELDNELKTYKSYRSKLNALENSKSYLDSLRMNEISINERFERSIAISHKICEIEIEAINKKIEALGRKVDKNEIKKSCYDFDDLHKPRNAWGLQ